MQYIQDLLFEKQDKAFAEFHRRLVPNLEPQKIIGVRTPQLRALAKQISKEEICEAFLKELPHEYYEENQLHGFILSQMKDFDTCIQYLEAFLPYMDNWATCDQTSPKIFKSHKEELLPYIYKWIQKEHTYTVRFAIGMLMQHFLDEDFKPEYVRTVSSIQSEQYYINMEIAWYMATALAKQWDAVIPYLEQKKMEPWVHNKTIQKAKESYRITDEQKEYLKKLKIAQNKSM
ncbi:MAG: DNA alkylation repair protein [Lachnospiraceae bacterium]|nr:DNA alkylation repair protein [Lachnospiraceae bacterium]